ncbi:hypothetical protein ACCC97_04490 [Variovorax sp. Varisp85]|jgi:hypothetical protein|uniref:hypothetical protein n=1 Tax=unclassified Variovorax TaxID=663243 RepID=UPI000270EC5C|nr:hypothetical protein [Variovorax sp. CF313]EJL69375.1 hypothetical protein PMI12_05152 [Variovorax sp. CF313]
MAYAAYREHPGVQRTHAPLNKQGNGRNGSSAFYVLDVTVCCADALRVRRSIAGCPEAGVVRCEPLLHACSSQESDAPCVRLMIRLPLARYADVLHRLIECVPSGEIGRLVSWREHLARCGLRHGH